MKDVQFDLKSAHFDMKDVQFDVKMQNRRIVDLGTNYQRRQMVITNQNNLLLFLRSHTPLQGSKALIERMKQKCPVDFFQKFLPHFY